jgi:hypothetical protein
MLNIEEQENTARFWNDVDANLILVKSEVANEWVQYAGLVKRERDALMKALKGLIISVEQNSRHLETDLKYARGIIADLDPTIKKCNCCYETIRCKDCNVELSTDNYDGNGDKLCDTCYDNEYSGCCGGGCRKD